ncbi:hypothetical protein B0H11DRAFT_2220074 [Mycena galericulata]|nr:hypothetical protein B0H11DRAFT_2222431 [Mycena galericulata]KAJ7506160.1 hypothetical protein B0H11DRAFT_2220074 [Mycena galericulata]
MKYLTHVFLALLMAHVAVAQDTDSNAAADTANPKAAGGAAPGNRISGPSPDSLQTTGENVVKEYDNAAKTKDYCGCDAEESYRIFLINSKRKDNDAMQADEYAQDEDAMKNGDSGGNDTGNGSGGGGGGSGAGGSSGNDAGGSGGEGGAGGADDAPDGNGNSGRRSYKGARAARK